MSVILKGCEIKMPHSCDICPFCGCDYTCMNYTADCYGEDISDYSMCRHEKCNLVEIPEGARLIDAKELKKKVLKWLPSDPCGIEERERPFETDICVSMLMEIDEAPTVFEE